MFRATSNADAGPAKAGTPYALPNRCRRVKCARVQFARKPTFPNALRLLTIFLFVATAALSGSGETQDNTLALEALSRLQGVDLDANPGLKAVVLKLLDKTRGTAQFVQITKQFHFQDQDAGLLEVAIA